MRQLDEDRQLMRGDNRLSRQRSIREGGLKRSELLGFGDLCNNLIRHGEAHAGNAAQQSKVTGMTQVDEDTGVGNDD